MRWGFLRPRYISLKQASELTGYSSDYIGYLARKERVDARKKAIGFNGDLGEAWFVKKKDLLSYQKKVRLGRRRKTFWQRHVKDIPSIDQLAKTALSALLVLIMAGGLYLPPLFASSVNFYPTVCKGSWDGTGNAQGAPLVPHGSNAFNSQNSAVMNSDSGSQIYCGSFQGEWPDDSQIKEAKLYFSLGAKFGDDAVEEPDLDLIIEDDGSDGQVDEEGEQEASNETDTKEDDPARESNEEQEGGSTDDTSEEGSEQGSSDISDDTQEDQSETEEDDQETDETDTQEDDVAEESNEEQVDDGVDGANEGDEEQGSSSDTDDADEIQENQSETEGGDQKTDSTEDDQVSSEGPSQEEETTEEDDTAFDGLQKVFASIKSRVVDTVSSFTSVAFAKDTNPENDDRGSGGQSPDVLEISYSFNGEWHSLGTLSMDELDSASFSIPLERVRDLENLQVQLQGVPNIDIPSIYLDGMWVEVVHEPEEETDLPRVQVDDPSLILNNPKSDLSAADSLEVSARRPDVSSEELIDMVADKRASILEDKNGNLSKAVEALERSKDNDRSNRSGLLSDMPSQWSSALRPFLNGKDDTENAADTKDEKERSSNDEETEDVEQGDNEEETKEEDQSEDNTQSQQSKDGDEQVEDGQDANDEHVDGGVDGANERDEEQGSSSDTDDADEIQENQSETEGNDVQVDGGKDNQEAVSDNNDMSYFGGDIPLGSVRVARANDLDVKGMTATLYNPSGSEASLQPTVEVVYEYGEEDFSIKMDRPKSGFRPGRYELEVEVRTDNAIYVTQQDFTWGVLAVNVDKSVYTEKDDRSYIQMGVLDDEGHTICGADLDMQITSPNGDTTNLSTNEGTIEYSGECAGDTYVEVPDYFAYYNLPGDVGEYDIELTAHTENGERTIEDSFEVREYVPFDVEREGPTRIFPPADYEVNFTVTANEDFVGEITESIPSSFELIDSEENTYNTREEDGVTEIVWDVNLSEGDTKELSYVFNAPDVSPEFYLLGPLSFTDDSSLVFEELRQWQVASDSTHHMIMFWDGGTAPTGWSCISCGTGDDFYQTFIRAADTYGATGGSDTHNHTGSGTTTNQSGTQDGRANGLSIAAGSHTHEISSVSADPATSLPEYRDIKVIKRDSAGTPQELPAGVIGMFDTTSVPTGWTLHSTHDDRFMRGSDNTTSTGGSATHTHSVSVDTGGPSATSTNEGGGSDSIATDVHTHSGSTTTDSGDHTPPYQKFALASIDSAGDVPVGLFAFWTDQPESYWTTRSGTGGVYEGDFILPDSTLTAPLSDGAETHGHTDDSFSLGTTTDLHNTGRFRGGGSQASAPDAAHTHSTTVSYVDGSHLPPYRTAILLGILLAAVGGAGVAPKVLRKRAKKKDDQDIE